MDGTPVEGGYGIRAAILEDGGRYWCPDGRVVRAWPQDGCTVFNQPLNAEGLADGVVFYEKVSWRLWYRYLGQAEGRTLLERLVCMHLGRALQVRDWGEVQVHVRRGLMGAVQGGPVWERLYDRLEEMAPDPDQVRRERIAWLGQAGVGR